MDMKVYYSPMSPFVRKVLVVAHELSLGERIELLGSAAHPIDRDAEIVSHNPLGQVPTFFTDDGTVLYDSRVICEYLDDLAGGSIFPGSPERRWIALREQALCDGILAAALAVRYEHVARPEERRFPDWIRGQTAKITDGLAVLEREIVDSGKLVDIGTISVACVLSYLDLRFPEMGWRTGHPNLEAWYAGFSERPSMKATELGRTHS